MAELQMDKLAEKLGLDPVEFRHRNALREGDTLNVGTPAPGRVSIVQCIEAAAQRAGWDKTTRRMGRNQNVKTFNLPT